MRQIHRRRLIMLSSLAKNKTKTNPHVGSFLYENDLVTAEDYHRNYGGPHAELNSIRRYKKEKLTNSLTNNSIFVSLEPCNHHGKTPPCTDLIVKNEISSCHIIHKDPNPLMQGKSLTYLKEQGVNVTVEGGPKVRSEVRFEKNITTHLPYIILKCAVTADGFMDDRGQPIAITSPLTNIISHKWRSDCDAILIGRNTLLNDNPKLTVRNFYGDDPLRIVLSSQKIEYIEDYHIADDQNYLEINVGDSSEGNQFFGKPLSEILKLLYDEYKIGSILVEGGSKTLQSFIDADLWDEIRILRNPALEVNAGTKMPNLKDAHLADRLSIRGNELELYVNQKYLLKKN